MTVKDNIDFLRVLSKCNSKQRKAILETADNKLLKALCECVLNVLQATVPISPIQKRKLARHKNTLHPLADRGISLSRKKQLILQQGGNFLQVLLPPVLSVLASLL